MAKDLFHDAVKAALQKDGWEITHDPYIIEALDTDLKIDLGARRLIGAQRDEERIAVEVKSFTGLSMVYNFHLALGQYMNYLRALRKVEPDRRLFIAASREAYTTFFLKPDVSEAVKDFKLNLVIFDKDDQTVFTWLNS